MTDGVQRVERELQALSRHTATEVFATHRQAPDRLERSVYLLLGRLDDTGPMTIRELAEAFRLDLSTINRHTAAMTRAGLVERIPDPAGGIARRFRLTALGAERFQEHRAWVVDRLTRMLADWKPEEFAALLTSLEHLNASIEQVRRTVSS